MSQSTLYSDTQPTRLYDQNLSEIERILISEQNAHDLLVLRKTEAIFGRAALAEAANRVPYGDFESFYSAARTYLATRSSRGKVLRALRKGRIFAA